MNTNEIIFLIAMNVTVVFGLLALTYELADYLVKRKHKKE